MEKGMLPCCCVSESGVCIDKGHTDGSIRQFLKPTAISSWWLALARHHPLNHRQYIVNEQPVNDSW